MSVAPGPLCGQAVTVYTAWAARLRATLPAPIVFTNGVFDLLHAGHVACLEAARAEGASLVVGVNGDASARRLGKGPGRPLVPAADRARIVGALRAVSAVIVFDEAKPLALLCALRPEIYAKGGDYRAEDLCEAALMQEWGGRTVIVPRTDDRSTTALIQRALRAAPPAPSPATAATAPARVWA